MAPTKSRNRRTATADSRWLLQPLAPTLANHLGIHFPLPQPRRETARLQRGAFSNSELASWIASWLAENPGASNAEQLRAARAQLLEMEAATQLMENQDFVEAQALLERFVPAHPECQGARLNLADCYNVAGESEKALETLDAGGEQFAKLTRALLIRSRALVALKRRDEAAALLRPAYARTPNNTVLRDELVRIGELFPTGDAQGRHIDRPTFRKQLQAAATERLQAGNAAGVLVVVRQAVQVGMRDLAHELLDRLEAQEPDNTAVQIERAVVLMDDGRFAEAETCYKALAEGGMDVRLQLGIAVGRQEGRRDEGAAMLLALLEQDPDNMAVAENYVLLHDGDEARLEASRRLIEKFPQSWVALKLLGDMDFRLGDFEDALVKHRRAYELSQSDDALTMLLHDLDRLERVEEAVQIIGTMADLAERSGTVRWNAANIYLRSGRVRPAVQILEGMIRDARLPATLRQSATRLLNDVRSSVQGRR